jgi:hypothetical protein
MGDSDSQGYIYPKMLIAVLAVVAGPVFAASSALAACAPAASAPPVCLTGTTVTPDKSVAVVEQAGVPGQAMLELHDTIRNWRVVEISQKYIKMEHAGRTVQLDVPELSTAVATNIKRGPMKHPRTKEARGESVVSQ